MALGDLHLVAFSHQHLSHQHGNRAVPQAGSARRSCTCFVRAKVRHKLATYHCPEPTELMSRSSRWAQSEPLSRPRENLPLGPERASLSWPREREPLSPGPERGPLSLGEKRERPSFSGPRERGPRSLGPKTGSLSLGTREGPHSRINLLILCPEYIY